MNFTLKDLQNNNPNAVSGFVDEHKQLVYRVCLGYLQNEDDANDLTQEVFVKAIRSIDTFKEKSSIKTWLTRIAINLSLNYLRDNKKHRQSADVDQAYNFPSEENTEADFKINQHELKQNLAIAIKKLPERQRRVFVLFHYNNNSYTEIAEVVKSSEKSVESLLQRARKSLQKELSEFYKENFN